MHAHTHTRTDVCTHAHMYAHAQACMHTHVYTHVQACTRTYTCVHTHVHIHTYTCIQRHRLFVLQRARPVRVQIPAQTQIPAGRAPLQLVMGTQRQGMALTQTSQVCDCPKRLHSLQVLQGLLPRGNAWSDPKAPRVARDEEAVQADGQTCPGHRAGQRSIGRSPGGSLFLPGLLPR